MLELKKVDLDYNEVPDARRIATLRGMLTGKTKDHIDMNLTARDYDKDELLTDMRRYAALTRREMTNANAMEVDAVSKGKRTAT